MYRFEQKGKTQEHTVMDMSKKGTRLHLVLLILISLYIFLLLTLLSYLLTYSMEQSPS